MNRVTDNKHKHSAAFREYFKVQKALYRAKLREKQQLTAGASAAKQETPAVAVSHRTNLLSEDSSGGNSHE